MMVFENSLIFFPTKYPEGNWEPWGITWEDASFAAADGTQIHGWYVPHERPRAVILFCHGNAGNVTHRDHVILRCTTAWAPRSWFSTTAVMARAKANRTKPAFWPMPARPARG